MKYIVEISIRGKQGEWKYSNRFRLLSEAMKKIKKIVGKDYNDNTSTEGTMYFGKKCSEEWDCRIRTKRKGGAIWEK